MTRQRDGVEPELALTFRATNMNVRRFVPLVGVEMETKTANS